MADSGLLVFLSGPSGVGKSTICRQLAQRLPAEFALSATTRPGKPQDAWGKKYLFVTEPEFKRLLEAGELLEYALVFGNWYGTMREPVKKRLAEGGTVLLEIDVQGGMQVHKMFPDALGIFVLPPTEDALQKRLIDRGRDDEQTMLRRVTEARQEVRTARECGSYEHLVVNNVVDDTVREIIAYIQQRKKTL